MYLDPRLGAGLDTAELRPLVSCPRGEGRGVAGEAV